jgi:hypothetical protein
MRTPQQVQSQVLDYMSQGRQAALQLADTMTTTWGGGSGAVAGAPFPDASDVVDQVFDFWVQLLETQRALAHSWLAAVTAGGLAAEPLVDVSPGTAPVTPRTPATPTTPGSSTTASSTPARTAASTADEKVSAAASDAVARAAGLTAAKTRP